MSENTQSMKQERERRYAILITALQDFMGADSRYTNELENLLGVQKKAVETTSKRERARRQKEELEKKEGEENAKTKSGVHE
jgi:hypothetical protein